MEKTPSKLKDLIYKKIGSIKPEAAGIYEIYFIRADRSIQFYKAKIIWKFFARKKELLSRYES